MPLPTHLRIEHGPRPLGIGHLRPRLSWWRVRVGTDLGWSAWSGLAEFETGLLETSDWQARFIGASPSTCASGST